MRITIQHPCTNPHCTLYRPPRNRITRWWYDRHRVVYCEVCTQLPMTEYESGGFIPGPARALLEVTECVIAFRSIQEGSMACCRTDEQHVRLVHSADGDTPTEL